MARPVPRAGSTPGSRPSTIPEGEPYPRTHRRLAWYRPDGWLAAGRRLRSADLVVFALLTPLQVPPYLAVLASLGRKPKRPRTAVIAHNVLPHERRPGDVALTKALLSHADTVITHSAAQAAQARELAPGATVRTVRMPPHLPATDRQIMGPNGPARSGPCEHRCGRGLRPCSSSASSAPTRAWTCCCGPWPARRRTSR